MTAGWVPLAASNRSTLNLVEHSAELGLQVVEVLQPLGKEDVVDGGGVDRARRLVRAVRHRRVRVVLVVVVALVGGRRGQQLGLGGGRLLPVRELRLLLLVMGPTLLLNGPSPLFGLRLAFPYLLRRHLVGRVGLVVVVGVLRAAVAVVVVVVRLKEQREAYVLAGGANIWYAKKACMYRKIYLHV